MTVFDKAKQIAKNKMIKEEVFEFFTKTKRDVIEYIGLFRAFGIDQNTVWDLYEEWQEQ